MSKASVQPGTSAAKTSLPVASRPGIRKPTTMAAGLKKEIAKVPTTSDRNLVFNCAKSVEPMLEWCSEGRLKESIYSLSPGISQCPFSIWFGRGDLVLSEPPALGLSVLSTLALLLPYRKFFPHKNH